MVQLLALREKKQFKESLAHYRNYCGHGKPWTLMTIWKITVSLPKGIKFREIVWNPGKVMEIFKEWPLQDVKKTLVRSNCILTRNNNSFFVVFPSYYLGFVWSSWKLSRRSWKFFSWSWESCGKVCSLESAGTLILNQLSVRSSQVWFHR